MQRYYKRPALLIECEDGRPFGLVNPSEIGPEITPQSVTSKLTLVLLHFPKLRLLWCACDVYAYAYARARARACTCTMHMRVHACAWTHAHARAHACRSRSAAHTVAIFAALKHGHPEPDVAAAAAVGAPQLPGADAMFNMTPQDVLRQLPGVHAHNCRRLMNEVPNLRELSTTSRDKLCTLLGAANGRQLHEFLHRSV